MVCDNKEIASLLKSHHVRIIFTFSCENLDAMGILLWHFKALRLLWFVNGRIYFQLCRSRRQEIQFACENGGKILEEEWNVGGVDEETFKWDFWRLSMRGEKIDKKCRRLYYGFWVDEALFRQCLQPHWTVSRKHLICIVKMFLIHFSLIQMFLYLNSTVSSTSAASTSVGVKKTI